VHPRGLTVRLNASDRAIGSGQAVRLTGRMVRAGTSLGISRKAVVLQRRTPGTRWVTFDRDTTSARGAFAKRFRPGRTSVYRAVFNGTTGFRGDTSGVIRVRVR